MTSDLECFLTDALAELIERAKESQDRRKGAGIGAQNEDFEAGSAMAHYQVLSYILNLARTFGVSPDAVPAVSFDADKELLG